MIFVDANIWISFANKKDRDHQKAIILMDKVRKREFGLPVTSDYVVDEVLTTSLIRTKRIDLAIKVGKIILGSPEEEIPALAKLLRVDESVFTSAWKTFSSGKYQGLSFTDHTILAQLQSLGIDMILSFDTDFDGLVRRIT